MTASVTNWSNEVHAFLRDLRFATLATINRDGTPQQSTIWYDLDGDFILMNTKRGRLKERNLRRDPRASICLEDGYRYLTILGRVTLIDEQAIAQSDIHRLSARYHGPQRAEQQMRDQFSREERVSIRLVPENLTLYGF